MGGESGGEREGEREMGREKWGERDGERDVHVHVQHVLLLPYYRQQMLSMVLY